MALFENALLVIYWPVLLAIGLGIVIGLERELAQKPAGIRTHMLVAGAATLLVLLADLIVSDFAISERSGVINADPIRIFEAIIVGVSFVGTGTIFRSEGSKKVEGLTTAASLLFVATIGIAVGVGEYLLAILLTVTVVILGVVVQRLEDYFIRRRNNAL